MAHLGFTSFVEAFNTLACGLGASPASIKNYRDELEPFFPNARRGWANRPIRSHCQRILQEYGQLDLVELGSLLRASLAGDSLETIGDELEGDGWSAGFAQRLQTGLAAETYFVAQAKVLPAFCGYDLADTTRLGCGFDFRLTRDDAPSLAVEVKGVREASGNILLTDKEYRAADRLRGRYVLFVVCGFAEIPFHVLLWNPVHSDLVLEPRLVTRQERTWQATVSPESAGDQLYRG